MIATLGAGPVLALAWVLVSVAAALAARRALSPEAAAPGLADWLSRLRAGEPVPPLDAADLGPLASCAEDLNALAEGQQQRDLSLARLQVPLQRIPDGIARAREVMEASGATETIADYPARNTGWHLMKATHKGEAVHFDRHRPIRIGPF